MQIGGRTPYAGHPTKGSGALRQDSVMVSPLFTSEHEHEVEENTTEPVVALAADDPDGGEVTFAIAGGEDAGLFEIRDGDQLAFVGPPDFEAPGDAGGDNEYQVAVTATDDEGETSEQPITVAVTDDPGEPPVDGPPAGVAALDFVF